MFEDDPRNLAVPHGLGVRTVLVGARRPEHPHVHHQTEDLAGFLARSSSDRGRTRRSTCSSPAGASPG